ncbi:MAG: NAD-dependent epimerase/dehydratase family protein, partial [Kiloniellales bacterium]
MAVPVITIFGGSGFIGRYVVRRLAKQGWTIRVAVRDPERAKFLRPLGDVGQITPLAVPLQNADTVAAAVAGADAVINLVGLLYERGRQTFGAVHVERSVRAAVPDAVICRPSLVIGPEDDFFNRFALYARLFRWLPLIGGGHTRFQPVYVGDVAEAIVRALGDP